MLYLRGDGGQEPATEVGLWRSPSVKSGLSGSASPVRGGGSEGGEGGVYERLPVGGGLRGEDLSAQEWQWQRGGAGRLLQGMPWRRVLKEQKNILNR